MSLWARKERLCSAACVAEPSGCKYALDTRRSSAQRRHASWGKGSPESWSIGRMRQRPNTAANTARYGRVALGELQGTYGRGAGSRLAPERCRCCGGFPCASGAGRPRSLARYQRVGPLARLGWRHARVQWRCCCRAQLRIRFHLRDPAPEDELHQSMRRSASGRRYALSWQNKETDLEASRDKKYWTRQHLTRAPEATIAALEQAARVEKVELSMAPRQVRRADCPEHLPHRQRAMGRRER